MKTIFYMAGHIPHSEVDYELTLDGNLIPNHASQNIGPDINVILELDEIGLTDAQAAVMQQMASLGEIIVRIEVT